MPSIVIETYLAIVRERCFDLARDVDIHCQTADFTAERVVSPGKFAGRLELHDLVTFEAVHLGVRQRLTARIIQMERPQRFMDEQVRGVFHSLVHLHEFEEVAGGTLMRDTVTWVSSLGLLGKLADVLLVKRHLHWFLTRKQRALKELAERGTSFAAR
jgi:ligand-binding SRPBCC domain-containing protein